MTIFPCVCCGKPDSKTNAGGLFCHHCSDTAPEKTKDELFAAWVNRMASLAHDFEEWERAA